MKGIVVFLLTLFFFTFSVQFALAEDSFGFTLPALVPGFNTYTFTYHNLTNTTVGVIGLSTPAIHWLHIVAPSCTSFHMYNNGTNPAVEGCNIAPGETVTITATPAVQYLTPPNDLEYVAAAYDTNSGFATGQYNLVSGYSNALLTWDPDGIATPPPDPAPNVDAVGVEDSLGFAYSELTAPVPSFTFTYHNLTNTPVGVIGMSTPGIVWASISSPNCTMQYLYTSGTNPAVEGCNVAPGQRILITAIPLHPITTQPNSLEYVSGAYDRFSGVATGQYNLLAGYSQGFLVWNENQPPSINSIADATRAEGTAYTANGSFTDSGSTSWTATVNYGDGTGTQSLPLLGNTFSLNHVYKDNGVYTVTVTVTDNQGEFDTETATVTVSNVVPTLGTISVSNAVVQVAESTNVSATFSDPGVLDTHTAVWNWGDSTTSNGTVTETNGSGSVSNSHSYSSVGVYEVTLTLTDKDTGQATQTYQYISVYAPSAHARFTAGQKYTSPAGALRSNLSLTGQVKFGLSYEYQGSTPTDKKNFSMDFDAANFHFEATSVTSLVITNGIAILRGTGTLNGVGTYTFLVTGSESTDMIRIQIKDQSGTVVYDTLPNVNGNPAPDTATPSTPVTGNVLVRN